MRLIFKTIFTAIAVSTMLAMLFLGASAKEAQAFDANVSFVSRTYASAANSLVLPYRLYVPENYDATKSYPLIVFLHGAGERGNDNAAQLKNGILVPFGDPNSPIHNCIVVAPQCPAGKKWVEYPNGGAAQYCQYSTDMFAESAPLKALLELIDVLKGEYNVDSDRIYATGLSMGGYGTWDLLARHGDIFAAAIPVCGGVDVSHADIYKDIPIYTFHGLKDTTVPSTGTLNVVDKIKELGGEKITLVTYPDGAHSIWNTAYGTQGLFEWLLSNKLSDRTKAEETTAPAETTTEIPEETTTVPEETTIQQESSVDTTLESETSVNEETGCAGMSAFAVLCVSIVSILSFAVTAFKKL